MINERPTHLDLFSGIGGFALAAQWAGFRTVGFCEIDPYCQAILKARFNAVSDSADNGCNQDRPKSDDERQKPPNCQQQRNRRNGGIAECCGKPRIHSDIFKLDGREYAGVSLITGGFPCQPFSCAGKRRGKEDDRFLWPEMLRVVSEARPAWVLGENVAGIVTMELDRVLSDLENINYAVWTLVIPACAVDAKHRRDRVWIMAHAGSGGREQGSARRSGKTGTGPCDESGQPGQDSSDVANASIVRFQDGSGMQSGIYRPKAREWQGKGGRNSCGREYAQWLPEPDVGRVAHGVSHRVDRLKGLGNAIVPQVAIEILKVIRGMITSPPPNQRETEL